MTAVYVKCSNSFLIRPFLDSFARTRVPGPGRKYGDETPCVEEVDCGYIGA